MALTWPSSGAGGGTGLPCHLTLAQNYTPSQVTKHQKIPGSGAAQVGIRVTHGTERPVQANTQRLSGTWVQAEGIKGGQTDKERRKMQARGVGNRDK